MQMRSGAGLARARDRRRASPRPRSQYVGTTGRWKSRKKEEATEESLDQPREMAQFHGGRVFRPPGGLYSSKPPRYALSPSDSSRSEASESARRRARRPDARLLHASLNTHGAGSPPEDREARGNVETCSRASPFAPLLSSGQRAPTCGIGGLSSEVGQGGERDGVSMKRATFCVASALGET